MTWIEDRTTAGKLPAIPQRLNHLFMIVLENQTQRRFRIEILDPSNQQLNALTPLDEQIMTEISDWDGKESWEDRKHRTRQMV